MYLKKPKRIVIWDGWSIFKKRRMFQELQFSTDYCCAAVESLDSAIKRAKIGSIA
jgi:hypothetical protein